MDKIIKHRFFLGSILVGILTWLVLYLILPVIPKVLLQFETITFIVVNYLALILGYFVFNFKIKSSNKKKIEIQIKILICFILVCFIFRWVDLFFVRGLSFLNDFKTNRVINKVNFDKTNYLLILAAVLKSLYFFPFVIVYSVRTLQKKKALVVLAYFLLTLPFIEAVLMGTRKPFLEVFCVLCFTFFSFNRTKISFQKIAFAVLSIVVLLTISMSILFIREKKEKNNEEFYSKLLNVKYNDLLVPNQVVKNYVKDSSKNEVSRLLLVTGLHMGQYFSHGIYEFNYVMCSDSVPYTKGKYTFFVFPKFINKTNLFEKISLKNPSPRKIVYLTAFGGLYLDFRWFSILFMLFFGVFQKYCFQISVNFPIWRPLLMYILIINVFLPSINYIRGAGIYPLISFLLFFIFMKISVFKST
ncbi:hypothetical protein [Algibacter sp. L4_22]|uniref:hypothetical protein n=1 Tax=Algibacter sp. L4_22 TaxID=2942477 RepID=UPI00201B90AB|nr:hypothetical protein [Algibacter sp. L4_22]MCL5127263.1 hypothetical protein [Algibacter sp. L4_22]